jgi:hydroxymethylglutaryl-CoA reductase (NADPH)
MIKSFLPTRFRGAVNTETPPTPSWLNKKVTLLIQSLSLRAYLHPIHTIVIVAFLASTTYIGLIESSLFDAVNPNAGKADWTSLVEGSRQLRVGLETGWKWQTADSETVVPQNADHLALLTFVFPDSLAANSPQNAPPIETVPLPENLTVTALPTTSNPLAMISQDSALAFAVPYNEAPEFLAKCQELPNVATETSAPNEAGPMEEQKMWIMKAARAGETSGSVRYWATNAWTEFVDLLKNAETLDIIIMVLGYISMHLTFASLFGSMRQMGSNFWLFATTLFSSVFAFLFGLIVTTKLGVPINMVLLSEGLPFLVVTIGFEKAITLTRAVLSAALDSRRPIPQNSTDAKNEKKQGVSPSSIQYAVQAAINEKGFDIVRDYAIEICILVAGAASGVQGGLQQFCFLAAWILFFDCVLLFTFYTAILSIKLEINRIKRHVALRQQLEDDGISRRVAEDVAQSDDYPRAGNEGAEPHIFGRKVKDSSIPKFKVLMVSGFIIINILNLASIPFRGGKSNAELPTVTGLSGNGLSSVMTAPPLDPFKVASNGLDSIYESAKSHGRSTVVTILTPIKYELEYPSVHYANPNSRKDKHSTGLSNATEFGNYGMSGRVVDSLLKSLEDPILSKWIIMALVLSVVLNGYLFNAARWSIKEPLQMPAHHAVNPVELQNAENFNNPTVPLVQLNGVDGNARLPPPTPATTDDEDDLGVMMADVSRPQKQLRRTQAQMEQMLMDKKTHELTDKEVEIMSLQGKIPGYNLERVLKDTTRAVKVRRAIISRTDATSETTSLLETSKLPYENYDYDRVLGACCENVIGYMPIPLGVAGPVVIDGQSFFIPMATTEGVLVASVNRGMKCINSGGGAVTILHGDGMTRGPCISFETLERAGAAMLWLKSEAGAKIMTDAFNSTSRFARLQSIETNIGGTYLYPRFKTTTGDAMGMNMISKGVEHALEVMRQSGFEDMDVISVSGNFCTDKKAAAVNWINGRGKSVVAEAIIPGDVIKKVLKTTVEAIVELNTAKNLVGSALAGTVGGNNAQAANLVAALFIATGQDPAQVVESSNCLTFMKK